MPQVIEVPGFGDVEFPDGMTDEQIVQAIQSSQGAGASQQSAPAQPAPPADNGRAWAQDSALAAFGGALGAGVGNVALGAQRFLGQGLQAIGADSAGDWLVQDADQGRQRLQSELSPYRAASPNAVDIGELGGEIAATLPVGGLLARGVRAAAPYAGAAGGAVNQLANSLATGGVRTGAAPTTLAGRAGNTAIRAAGGGAAGAVSAGLVDEDAAGTGAVVGAAFPVAAPIVGRGLQAAGRAARSLVDPLSEAGQGRIADQLIQRMAVNGPTTIDNAAYIPGSQPTLAQATGNPGLAGLERGLRNDPMIGPQFVARDRANAAARTQAFDDVAGDAAKLDLFRAHRETTANDLYGQAIMNYTGQTTPYIRGQITQLLKRPSIDKASRIAQRWAIERGEKPDPAGSLRALHDVKGALDDMIGEQLSKGKKAEAKALQATKTKLLDVMDKLSPEYAQARVTYQQMSEPINAMEFLQGLRLTDQRGNITLAKVNQALQTMQRQQAAPGVAAAKSLNAQQINVLTALRDDLLRADNTNAGRAVGSNTVQNLGVNNLLANALPFGDRLSRTSAGGVVKRLGDFVYGGTDDPIRQQLANRLLDPAVGGAALSRLGQVRAGQQALPNTLGNLFSITSRTMPVLTAQ